MSWGQGGTTRRGTSPKMQGAQGRHAGGGCLSRWADSRTSWRGGLGLAPWLRLLVAIVTSSPSLEGPRPTKRARAQLGPRRLHNPLCSRYPRHASEHLGIVPVSYLSTLLEAPRLRQREPLRGPNLPRPRARWPCRLTTVLWAVPRNGPMAATGEKEGEMVGEAGNTSWFLRCEWWR